MSPFLPLSTSYSSFCFGVTPGPVSLASFLVLSHEHTKVSYSRVPHCGLFSPWPPAFQLPLAFICVQPATGHLCSAGLQGPTTGPMGPAWARTPNSRSRPCDNDILRNTSNQGRKYPSDSVSLYQPTTYTAENEDFKRKGKTGLSGVSFLFSPSFLTSSQAGVLVECECSQEGK